MPLDLQFWEGPLLCCCSVTKLCLTLRPHGLQHIRLPCPSLTVGVCSNSCPLSQWSHPAISSSVPLFFLRSIIPSIRSFPMNQLSLSGGQSIGSFSLSPPNETSGLISFRMDWFPCCLRVARLSYFVTLRLKGNSGTIFFICKKHSWVEDLKAPFSSELHLQRWPSLVSV